ncbi:MAG: phosphatase PAP2 family protein [Gammaproteobacteria bacterium]|nr:phosphatase PAP2 family protein [Gammaproteobacteria bacterium]
MTPDHFGMDIAAENMPKPEQFFEFATSIFNAHSRVSSSKGVTSMLESLDDQIVQLVNSLAHRSGTLDLIVVNVFTLNLVKGAVPVTMLCWAWFRECQDQVHRRMLVLGTLLGTWIALLLGRALQLYLPFRPRPLYNPELSLRVPEFLPENTLNDWSSLPSDTAMMFAALTLGIWFISRTLGIVALLHMLLFVVFAKLYKGLHYPSDLFVGAVIGMGITWFVLWTTLPQRLYHLLVSWRERAPGLFYSGFFLVFFEIANMFDDVRELISVAEFAFHGLQRVL